MASFYLYCRPPLISPFGFLFWHSQFNALTDYLSALIIVLVWFSEPAMARHLAQLFSVVYNYFNFFLVCKIYIFNMAIKETSATPCTKNTLTSAGPQDETKKFVDSVNLSSMEPAGVHCSVRKSEKPSRAQTGSLAISESRTYSAVGKHVSHRSSRGTSKQTRISTKRCSAPRDKKRERERGGASLAPIPAPVREVPVMILILRRLCGTSLKR